METSVDSMQAAYIDKHQGLAAYKDTQGIFRYANPAFSTLVGLPRPHDLIGRTVFDIPCDAVAYAEEFDEQDRQVMTSGRDLRVLNIHPFADGQWGVYLCTKRPWFDDDKKVVGMMGEAVDITDAYTMTISTQLAKFTGHVQSGYILSEDGGILSLSRRESEVLFLILRGKTSKRVANALKLSYHTVEQYMESIKLKFGVRSKAELIEEAIARGYMNHIPLSAFSKQLSIVLAA